MLKALSDSSFSFFQIAKLRIARNFPQIVSDTFFRSLVFVESEPTEGHKSNTPAMVAPKFVAALA